MAYREAPLAEASGQGDDAIIAHRIVEREWCHEPSCPWRRHTHEHDVLSPLAGTLTALMAGRWAA